MKPFRSIMLSIAAAGSAAFAVTGVSAASPSDPTSAIEQALTDAESHPRLRFSYTMTFETPGNPPIVQRFDASTKKWTTLSGDPKKLPKEAAQKLRNVMKSESVPGGLLYADFRPYLNHITYRETEDGQFVYAFVPPEANKNESVEELEGTLRARLYVDPTTNQLMRYEVRALRPFKPMPVAKLEEFAVVQDFEPLGENGPSVLRRLYSRTKGTRAFRKIDTEFTATFSDIQLVE